MSWSVQIFRLVANRTDPGLFCAKDELTLGGVPLLIRTNAGLRSRPSGDLQQVFNAAYGAGAAIDAVSRLPCLQSIGHALDAGNLSYAAMLEAKKVSFWFADVPDFIFRRFDEYNDTVNQAFRQNYSSGGRRVEWHYSDPDVARYWRAEFARLGFSNITVKYTPYDEFYNYGLDKFWHHNL